jgi:hypothetical protein
MTSSDLYVLSLTDAKDNHDRLMTFLACAARKYNESRQCSRKNRKCIATKLFVQEPEIDVTTQMNSSLFVNALLYYVFSEAGVTSMMLDKHGRAYPSNVFSKLYKPAWQREITRTREIAFKNIQEICCNILDQSDLEFASFVEQVLVLNYLNMCKEKEMPAYNPDTKKYIQKVNNTIMDWAANYVEAIILPAAVETPSYAIKMQQEDILAALESEALPTTSTKEQKVVTAAPAVASVASEAAIAPAVEQVEEEQTQIELHPAKPEELAEAFKTVCLAMEAGWSAEVHTAILDRLAPARQLMEQLDAEIAALTIRRDNLANELKAYGQLMSCWAAKTKG